MMMRVLVLAALGCSGVYGLDTDIVRECPKTNCVSGNAGTALELSCGGAGEVIAEVVFASFGSPIGSCPSVLVENADVENVSLTESDGCHAVRSSALIEDLCLGEEECVIETAGLFSAEEAGLEGCIGGIENLEYSVLVSCSDTFDPFNIVSSGVIVFIGLALGASVEPHVFMDVFKSHKRGIIVGFLCQFGIMPLIAYLTVLAMSFEGKIALGVMLVGCMPGGTTSNLLTYYCKGSVALSITMSAASTLAALFMLPLLILLYVDTALGVDTDVTIPFLSIFGALLLAILPAIAGVYIRSRSARIAAKVEKVGAIIGIVFIAAALAIGALDNPDLVNIASYPRSWIGGLLFQPIGSFFGYVIARFVKLPHPEARAVCLETGLQNYILVISIVNLSLGGCDRVEVLTFPLIATICYVLNSIWITALLRYMSKFDSSEEVKMILEEKGRLEALSQAENETQHVETTAERSGDDRATSL